MLAEERRSRLLELVRTRGFAALPDWRMPWPFPSRRYAATSTSSRKPARPSERTAACSIPARPRSCPISKNGSRPSGTRSGRSRPAPQLIQDGDTLLLDGGTTTYEVARLLVGRHLQIVTNSLPVANLFASGASTDLVLVGGYVYPRTGVSLGPYANQMLANLSVRRTVLSVAGINDRGFFNSNLLLVETEQAMLHASEEVIVVADSAKFGHQSLANFCALERVDYLVVDHEIDPAWQKKVKAAGVELVIAEPPDAQPLKNP